MITQPQIMNNENSRAQAKSHAGGNDINWELTLPGLIGNLCLVQIMLVPKLKLQAICDALHVCICDDDVRVDMFNTP